MLVHTAILLLLAYGHPLVHLVSNTSLNADFRGQKMTHTFPHTLAAVMGT